MGVAEMTRFGMEATHFQELAQLIGDVILDDRSVKEEVTSLRQGFLEMRYCFNGVEYEDVLQKLYEVIR